MGKQELVSACACFVPACPSLVPACPCFVPGSSGYNWYIATQSIPLLFVEQHRLHRVC